MKHRHLTFLSKDAVQTDLLCLQQRKQFHTALNLRRRRHRMISPKRSVPQGKASQTRDLHWALNAARSAADRLPPTLDGADIFHFPWDL